MCALVSSSPQNSVGVRTSAKQSFDNLAAKTKELKLYVDCNSPAGAEDIALWAEFIWIDVEPKKLISLFQMSSFTPFGHNSVDMGQHLWSLEFQLGKYSTPVDLHISFYLNNFAFLQVQFIWNR